jgi:hypothetical protein
MLNTRNASSAKIGALPNAAQPEQGKVEQTRNLATQPCAANAQDEHGSFVATSCGSKALIENRRFECADSLTQFQQQPSDLLCTHTEWVETVTGRILEK